MGSEVARGSFATKHLEQDLARLLAVSFVALMLLHVSCTEVGTVVVGKVACGSFAAKHLKQDLARLLADSVFVYAFAVFLQCTQNGSRSSRGRVSTCLVYKLDELLLCCNFITPAQRLCSSIVHCSSSSTGVCHCLKHFLYRLLLCNCCCCVTIMFLHYMQSGSVEQHRDVLERPCASAALAGLLGFAALTSDASGLGKHSLALYDPGRCVWLQDTCICVAAVLLSRLS
jgi:hypothetical protein